MLPILALPLETSLMAYMELLIVLAFAIGWFILEKVANSYDRDKPKSGNGTRSEESSPE